MIKKDYSAKGGDNDDAWRHVEYKKRLEMEEEEKRAREREEKIWKEKEHYKLLEKITIRHEGERYYERLPVKPGFDFLRTIAEAVKEGAEYSMLLPPTLGIFDEKFLLYTDP